MVLKFVQKKDHFFFFFYKGWGFFSLYIPLLNYICFLFYWKVDAIVNSTNAQLNLNEGFVSSRILKHGGKEIQDNLITAFRDGIRVGDIADSIPGKLDCKIIIHCVLLNWISVGNLSCKVSKNPIYTNTDSIFTARPLGVKLIAV